MHLIPKILLLTVAVVCSCSADESSGTSIDDGGMAPGPDGSAGSGGGTLSASAGNSGGSVGDASIAAPTNAPAASGGSTAPRQDASTTGVPVLKASINPSSFAFGDAIVGKAGATKVFEVSNEGNVPLGALATVTTGGGATAFLIENSTCSASLAVGASCTFSVSFRPQQTGEISASLKVNAADVALAMASVGGKGVEAGTLTGEPQNVLFDSVFQGTSKDIYLDIKNGSPSAVSVTRTVSGDMADFSIFASCLQKIPPGGSCRLRVQFHPTATGDRSASITFDGGDAGVFVLTLRGAGKSGDLTVSPGTYDFGTVQRGQGNAKVFVVSAQDAEEGILLGPLRVVRSEADFVIVDDGCSGKTLARGQTCTFGVKLAGAGPFGATQGNVNVYFADLKRKGVLLKAIATVPPTGPSLIAEWRFDNNTSDSSPNQNHGEAVAGDLLLSSPAAARYVVNSNGHFLSLADKRWVLVDRSATLARPLETGGLSAAMWLRSRGSRGIGYALSWSTISTFEPEFAIGINWDEGVWFAQAGFLTVKSTTKIDDAWHHIAATNDGGAMRLYVDGKLEGQPVVAGLMSTSPRPFVIGAKPSPDDTGVSNFFIGDIDGLKLYDRNLTDAEVLTDKGR